MAPQVKILVPLQKATLSPGPSFDDFRNPEKCTIPLRGVAQRYRGVEGRLHLIGAEYIGPSDCMKGRINRGGVQPSELVHVF